jgi:hypothetical protein
MWSILLHYWIREKGEAMGRDSHIAVATRHIAFMLDLTSVIWIFSIVEQIDLVNYQK